MSNTGVARPESAKGVDDTLPHDVAGSAEGADSSRASGLNPEEPFNADYLFADGGGGGGVSSGLPKANAANSTPGQESAKGPAVNPPVANARGSEANATFGAGLPTPPPAATGVAHPGPSKAVAAVSTPPAGPLDPVPEYDFGMANPAGVSLPEFPVTLAA
jgi:hypothetical protein